MNSLTNLLAFFSALFSPCAVQSSVVQPFRLLVFIHVQFFFFHCSLPLARCYFVNASSFSFDVIRLLYNYFFLLLLLLFGCCVRLCLVVVFFSMLHSSDNILCCYTAIRFMLWNFWCVTIFMWFTISEAICIHTMNIKVMWLGSACHFLSVFSSSE